MRSWFLLALLGCGSSATTAPMSPPATAPAVSTDPHCSVDTSYWTTSKPIDPRAPIAVVFGLNGWGGGADRPALAVWPDGEVLDDGTVGRIPAARAAELAHEVADRLRDQPPRVSLTEAFDTPSTLIAVRDGSRWRVVHVEGLAFRGVRALATVRAANAAPDRSPSAAITGALGVFAALDGVSRRDAYAPEAVVLTAQRIPPNTAFAEEWPGVAIAWPPTLPAPPAPRDKDDATFELVVPGKLAGEVDRLAETMASGGRPVTIRGGRWMFYANERYRGEEAVSAARECADTEYVRRWRAENGAER